MAVHIVKLARVSALVVRYGIPQIATGLFRPPKEGLRIARDVVMPAILRICGADLQVVGAERVDWSAGCVLVSNHESTMDIAAMFAAVPVDLYFIAKTEVRHVPIMGRFVQQVGMILIDRKHPKAALQRLRDAAQRVAHGLCVIAFPEGTRQADKRVHRFKKGAFVLAQQAGVPVVPVAIVGSRHVLGDRGLFDAAPGTIRLAFGEPIDTTAADLTLDALIEAAFERVVALHIKLGGLGAA